MAAWPGAPWQILRRSLAPWCSRWWRRLCPLLCGWLVLLGAPAQADVWGFLDEHGVAHFAAEQVDARYALFFKGASAADAATGVAQDSRTPRAVAVPTAPPKLLAFFEVSPRYKRVKHHLRDAARDHGVDYALLQAVIATESGFDAQAVSPKGAVGLMQIMPLTAQRYGVQANNPQALAHKLMDAKVNIRVGTRYLRDLIKQHAGQMELALAAYNAGEGAVRKAGNQVPNYRETQDYVKTVLQLYAVLKPPAAARPGAPPGRVRMALQGGASARANMVGPIVAPPVDFN